MSIRRTAVSAVGISLLLASSMVAQDEKSGGGAASDIQWVEGPAAGTLGAEASVRFPASCQFTGLDGVQRFLELTENPVGGNERGAILCEDSAGGSWFVIFTFAESGYVRDDERDELDADAMLRNMQRATEASNEERQRRGWGTLSIEGWITQPYYDTTTNNLTWALTTAGSDGTRSVNHSVRLLGRRGVMHVDLVAMPDQLAAVMPDFNGIVAGFEYLSGHRYSEWREGDRIASYGLTALVAGGAGVVAAKTGLLAKLWKVILAGAVALVAGIKAAWSRITGRGSETQPG